ncbi:MAG: V-type ATP synthase subunit D, partial [Methanomicrobiales archaeon]|nr:V-type ATP synthase subunit D [Methanomicrobiales archaeon]
FSFSFTSASLDEAVLSLKELAPKLIKLAEVQKRVDLMTKEIENTRRRVNAIEHIRLPNLRANIKMIVLKLDDHERFNTVRMMKSKELSIKKNK